MFNIDKIIGALQSDKNVQRSAMTGAAGLAAGMLMGGGGKKFLGTAVKAGTIAAVGGLAYKAWQNHQANQQAQQPAQQGGQPWGAPVREDAFIPAPAQENEQEELGKTLVRAMIAAAKADGKIDAEEKEAIFAKLETMNLSANEKAFVFDELASPLDLNAVVARADTPEHAAEIYAASLVAIEADTASERAYLAELARRLKLEPGLVTEIHKAAGTAPAEPAPAYTPYSNV